MSAIELIFWVSFSAILYSYALYAPIVWALSKLFGARSRPNESATLPSVSLIIAAHNEEDVIESRIRNALALDYPRDCLEIVIASDGSTDGTAQIVKRFPEMRLIDNPTRRGKAAVLNDAIAHARGEIILLSDANTEIESTALRALVRWFSDQKLGAVCGRLVLTDPATGRNVDSLYWKYETFLKRCESRLGALLGSNGAIYAIRRSVYQPLPHGTLVDDFVIPLLAKQKTDCAIVYDTDAIAHEQTPKDIRSEFARRARIGAGGFQSVLMLWRLLNPARGWIAFTFFSHKILRWLCPFFMLAMFVASAMLVSRPLYRAALIAQTSFYLVSMLAAWLPTRVTPLRPLRLTTMFTAMNAALFVGFFRWVGRMDSGVWSRTQR